MGDTAKIYEVNLQEVVEAYIWKRYKEDSSFLKNLLFRKNNHYIDIRWGFVDFKHTTTKTVRPLPLSARQKELDLYSAEYENETTDEQTYTFSTSRETTSSTSIEIQDSYTLGASTNIEVDLGGIVKVGGGLSGEMSVTETKGKQHSETQTWNIDSEIMVPKMCRATARLELKEISSVMDFEVKTLLSLSQRKLPVSIRKIADNQIVKTYWITNISKIFEKSYLDRTDNLKILKETLPDNTIDIQLELTTHGVCKSVAGKEQRVVVEYKPLTSKSNPELTGQVSKPTAHQPETDSDKKSDSEKDNGVNKDEHKQATEDQPFLE